jgi:hypothetical protein
MAWAADVPEREKRAAIKVAALLLSTLEVSRRP